MGKLDLVIQLENLRKLMTKNKGKFALANFTGENMPDILDDTFRIFHSHKLERHRLDNGLDEVKIDIYRDTIFDYASVIKSKLGGAWESYNKIISSQIALCDFFCWHCYVPDDLLRGDSKKINYFTPVDFMERFLAVRADSKKESYGSNVLRVSGGEPFLAPDFIIGCLEYLHDKGLENEIFLWTETNLSPFLIKDQTSLVETWLEEKGKSLKEFAKYKNFALHPCLHGTNPSNFAQITFAKEEYFNQLIEGLRLLVNLKIDVYPTIGSNTSPSTEISELFYKLKEINNQLPLRFALIPYSFDSYPAIDERLSKGKRQGIVYGKDAMVSQWGELLRENYNVNYAEIPRSKVKLYG